MNIAILVGGLTRDPEMRYTPAGTAVTTFSIGTDGPLRDGERTSDYHNIVVWGKKDGDGRGDNATRCAQYLKKGSRVAIRGRITTRKWEDQNGNQRYTTEIVPDIYNGVEFISGFKTRDEVDQESRPSTSGNDWSSDVDPDDIPF